jgi:phage terminase large subunit-like protein
LNPDVEVLLKHAAPEVKQRWITRLKWRLAFHKGQIRPAVDHTGWVVQAGRGFGKTTIGAIDVAEACIDYPGLRYGIIAPTLPDVRNVLLEGETGLIRILTDGTTTLPGLGLTEGEDFTYNRTLLQIAFKNKSIVSTYSAETPDRLRGPQHHRLWFDELASFSDAWKGDVLGSTFNNAMLGLRLTGMGATRYLVTTTPRPLKLMVELDQRKGVVVTRGSTYENLTNLSPEFAQAILQYEGTYLGRQELMGEIVMEHPDALWKMAWFDPPERRMMSVPPMIRVIVGVDPSGGTDEIGIVTAGRIASPCPCGLEDARGPHFAVVSDYSLNASPEQWAQVVANAYTVHKADRVVAERNFGGDMVESTLKAAMPELPVKQVRASRGKAVRAEPIAAVYEVGRVHHVNAHPELESEMTSWVPGESGWSPNRMDALVWAMTELVGAGTGVRRAHRPGKVRGDGTANNSRLGDRRRPRRPGT